MPLPADLDAEANVIGAMILRPEILHDILAILGEDDLHTSSHRAVYRAAARCVAAGTTVDVVSLDLELRRSGEQALVGGLEGLGKLTERYPTSYGALRYAERVRDVAAMRRLVVAASEAAEAGAKAAALSDPTGFVEQYAHRIAEAGQARESHQAVHVGAVVRDTVRDLKARKEGKRDGLSVQWPDLNELLRGFRPGQLIVVAARPGVGKTAIALDMARHLTRKAHTGLLFELEMCTEELGDRLLAAEAGVDTHDIEEGRLSEDRMGAVVQAAARIYEFALYIDDTPQLPIHILAARARAFHAKKPLSFILVDYLQLVKPSRRGHSRESEVSEISGSLLGLAKSLRVPVICCCQFNREAADREPRMDDLRESGAIEQDAAKIIALHPVPDDPKNPIPPERKAVHQQTKVLVLKNRRGPTGWAMLNFRKRSTTFVQEERR